MATGRRKKPQLPPPPDVIEDDTFVRNGSSQYKKRYKRGRMLGKGGFAVCYEATSYDSGRTYAAKVVYKRNLQRKKNREKLVNEIQIHRGVKHPYIVKLERHFEDKDHVYILLELCSSMTLMEMLQKRKRLTEAETQYFMLQLIDAVHYLHTRGIIHRDLKLGNIMLSEDLSVKLGDFGLAAVADENGRRFSVCGTPNYIAPEVLKGDKVTGHSFEVDIWSLGVIMYTLLVGKPPFETKDVRTTYKKIKKLNYTFPKGIELSKHAEHLIKRLLVLNASDRPDLNEIKGHTFFTYRKPLASLPKAALTHNWSVPERARDGPSLAVKRKRARQTMATPDVRSSKRICTHENAVCSTPVGFAREIEDQIEGIPHRGPSPEHEQENAYDTDRRQRRSRGRLRENVPPGEGKVHYDDGFRRPALPGRRPTPGAASGEARTPPDPPPGKLRRNDTDRALKSIYTEIERSFRGMGPDGDAAKDGGDSVPKPKASLANVAAPNQQQKPPGVKAPHPVVWVCRWVDYARKYGVGYYLTNGCTGVYFNDTTKIVLHPDRVTFTYVDRPPGQRRDTVTQHTLHSHPPELKKKVTLLTHFREYLTRAGEVPATSAFDPRRDLIYLKMWTRTDHAILFRLNNKTVQINFMDNTELILSSETRLVTYTDKQKQRITYQLKDILTTTRKDLRKRMRYTQDILKTLLRQ